MIIDTEKQNCGNCKNWSKVDPFAYGIRVPEGRRLCVRSIHAAGDQDPTSEMWTQDASDFYARTVTLPTFSCSQWEAK